ncbi:MAG: S4 domain-containing protein [Alphaproteobacteria bacterium]|nr:S4 domain-containing protein [Alphaproteobacteria bacterium]
MGSERLDKWLWHARVVKARSSMAHLIRQGHVRLNGTRVTSPGHVVRVGDVVTVVSGQWLRVLRVVGFATQRGNAVAAREIYQELEFPGSGGG